MNKVIIYTLIFVAGLLFSCKKNETAQNLIQILPEDSREEIIRKSGLVVPTENQYNWQKLEYTAFIHYGPNTFTGVEWGNGKENPSVFNPTAFDASQWISVIKDAGMKMAMLTVKHHDGFCLWQTTTTNHSVKSSPWKQGKGDVLGEVVRAAHNEGIKIGVYLSPADLHEIERENGSYGNGSLPKKVKIPSDPELQKKADKVYEYEVDDYNALFLNQLYELLTQYGKVEEVWFDGANPKPGLGQEYDRKAWYDLIQKLQPGAVIAIKGPDVRWCGNEAGRTRKSEWSVLPLPEHPKKYDWPDKTEDDLGSRGKLMEAKYLYWYPSETNTSVRIGWFYRDEKQYVKSVEQIVDTWYRSVGGNSVFLLNLTPDKRGLIPDKDAKRLREAGKIIAQAFENNLATDVEIQASTEDNSQVAKNAIDGNLETCWKPNDGNEQADLIVSFKEEKEINRVVLQECISRFGQRVEAFAIDIWKNNSWHELYTGTTIGYKNIKRFSKVKTKKVRLRILGSRIAPTIAAFELYNSPEMLANPMIIRNKEGVVNLSCKSYDPLIYYTIDGSEPNQNSTLFTKPFLMDRGGIVKAVAYVNNGKQKSEIIEERMGVCPAKWQLVSFTAEQAHHEAALAIDGDPQTYWHTQWGDNPPQNPHDIVVNLGEKLALTGFTYLPRNDGLGGICKSYVFEVSLDGENWALAKKGEFGNIKNNPVNQMIIFDRVYHANYVRFTSLSNINGDAYLSMAELGVLTK